VSVLSSMSDANAKQCLVLGADGFIGSHVCEALLGAGHRVRAFDISHSFDALGHLHSPRLERVHGDFLDRAAVREALDGAQWVFHLVSTTLPATSNKNRVFDVQSNLVAGVELLESAVEAGVEKLLFASSGGTVYGIPSRLPAREGDAEFPIVSYGVIKLAMEKYCRLFRHQYGLAAISLRLANPYGPRHHGLSQGAVSVFLKRLRAGEPITIWGDGRVVRDYIYIGDVTAAFLAAARYGGPHDLFNIGSGQGVSLNELVALLAEVCGRELTPLYTEARRFDVPAVVLDTGLAQRELAWRPHTGLREGVRRTWEALLRESMP